jgi:hypothetical protein
MAIFKVPRITTEQRINLLMDASEIVYDIDLNKFYGGDGISVGGFPIGKSVNDGKTLTITLLEGDIENKRVVLEIEPMQPSSVLVVPFGGPPQVNGIDYTISGNVLSWDGLGLDGFLEKDEIILVQF